MAVIRLVTWDPALDEQRLRVLRDAGFEVQAGLSNGVEVWRAIRKSPPALVLIDLSRLPSHGRELARTLRTTKATRNIPIVFAGGERGKVLQIRDMFPDCPFVEWNRASSAVRKTMEKGPTPPAVVPKLHMQEYGGRALAAKLGIKPGMRVLVVEVPVRWDEMIAAMPEKAEVVTSDPIDLAIWFLADRAGLMREAGDIAGRAGKCPVWTAYLKQQKGKPVSDLTQAELRETLLGLGLTDYKICSIDDRWTALLWTRAKVH